MAKTVDVAGDGEEALLVEAPANQSSEPESSIWCLKYDQLKAILFDESSIYSFFQKQTDISAEAERILKSVKSIYSILLW